MLVAQCTAKLFRYTSHIYIYSCSVIRSCPTLCNSMDCSLPGFPVPHHLPEFAQFVFIALVIPSSHLILWCLLLLLPSIFLRISDFSIESSVCNRWPKYWSFSFSISPSSEYSGFISLKMTGIISLLSKGFSEVFSSNTNCSHPFFGILPSLWSSSQNWMWPLGRL